MTDSNGENVDGADASPPTTSHDPTAAPRRDPKRVLACGTCRKRKLKCDSKRPKCSTCARLGHPCEYDEIRKKSGPKRGYVKSLEARLNQLETLLEHKRDVPKEGASTAPSNISQIQVEPQNDLNSPTNAFNVGAPDLELGPAPTMHDHDVNLLSEMVMPGAVDFSWDMISLGLEEPLPSQDIMDELYQTYFEKVHPSLPMLHKSRFMTSLNLGPNSRPPVCLRYSMWANACSVGSKYAASADQFYRKARKYLEKDEMQGHGESFITIPHAQAWNLVACYEFKHMYFPRAWISVGRATRLVQMMGLHRQDRVGLDVKQTLGPPKDWIDREERRRTFWIAFCQDRYASIGTGWPMTIDEQDILTNLPASEESFLQGIPEPTGTLADVMKGDGVSSMSSGSSVILLSSLFGRNLTHLHRPSDDDNDHDLGGEFWKRHRTLDNIILNTSLSLPGHLRLPQGINDPKVIFANMNIHTATICLHQAAIFKADKHKLPVQISSESKRRCLVAADQIANLMRMISHMDLTMLNPFSAFCLYVASRVFVQYLKFKKDDYTVRSSLIFLLQAMHVLKKHNPLVESFMVQLDVDLEGSGITIPVPSTRSVPGEIPANFDAVKCSPLMDIRQSQNASYGQGSGASNESARLEAHVMTFDENVGNPYLSASVFDTDQSNSSHSGLTPSFSNGDSSSRSQSNHPTPASSSTVPNGLSPQAGGQSMRLEQSPVYKNTAVVSPGNNAAPGAIQGSFEMSPPPDEQLTMSMQRAMGQQSTTSMNLDQFNIGGTGLTPAPTGLTPSFAMSPHNEWQSMNVDENNNWMFQ